MLYRQLVSYNQSLIDDCIHTRTYTVQEYLLFNGKKPDDVAMIQHSHEIQLCGYDLTSATFLSSDIFSACKNFRGDSIAPSLPVNHSVNHVFRQTINQSIKQQPTNKTINTDYHYHQHRLRLMVLPS